MAKTAAFILFEVYDSCKLWALSKELTRGIRRLDSKIFLGNEGNVTECLSLIYAIERSKFREFPAG